MSTLELFSLSSQVTSSTPRWLRTVRLAATLRDQQPDLRRRLTELSKTLSLVAGGKQALSVAQIDEIVDIVLVFVLSPADRDQARELILDMTGDEFVRTINEITASLG